MSTNQYVTRKYVDGKLVSVDGKLTAQGRLQIRESTRKWNRVSDCESDIETHEERLARLNAESEEAKRRTAEAQARLSAIRNARK